MSIHHKLFHKLFAIALLVTIQLSIFCWSCGMPMVHTNAHEHVQSMSISGNCSGMDMTGEGITITTARHGQSECRYVGSPAKTEGVLDSIASHLTLNTVPAGIFVTNDHSLNLAVTISEQFPPGQAEALTGSVIKLE